MRSPNKLVIPLTCLILLTLITMLMMSPDEDMEVAPRSPVALSSVGFVSQSPESNQQGAAGTSYFQQEDSAWNYR